MGRYWYEKPRKAGVKPLRPAGVLALVLAVVWAIPAARGQRDVQGEWARSPDLGRDDFISNSITALETDKDEKLWVGTDRGLAWTSDAGRTWHVVNLGFAQPYVPDGGESDGPPETGRALSPRELARRNVITDMARGRNGLWVATLNGLCHYDYRGGMWRFFSQETGGPASEVLAVAAAGLEIWASTSDGLFRSLDYGKKWRRVRARLPRAVRFVGATGHGRGQAIWLAGFDSERKYGGGSDLLYSDDGGESWDARATRTASVVAAPVSAHTSRIVPIGATLWACTRHGLSRSVNGGKTWRPFRRRNPLSGIEVYDIDEADGVLRAATRNGLFKSRDGGKTWEQEPLLRCPVRRILDKGRYEWLGTGGGLLRHGRPGTWRVFSVRSHVLCLAKTQEHNRSVWWAGTTGGIAFSRDRGATWRPLTVADGLPGNVVRAIAADGDRIWAGTDGGIWTFTGKAQQRRRYDASHGLRGIDIRDIAIRDGVVYAATDKGLAVLDAKTQTWRNYLTSREWLSVDVLDGVVFGITNDPDRSGSTVLISSDLREEVWWAAYLPGHDGGRLRQVMAVGGDLWAAADSGVYRSRDEGVTWARVASKSLWATRALRLACGETNEFFVETLPTDPPAVNGAALLNFTRDGGRSWQAFPVAVPGQAADMLLDGDTLVVGTMHGVSAYEEFARDLRAERAGWFTWQRVAALAASTYREDRLGWVSCVDEYAFHGPTFWLGSAGDGMIERGVPILDEINRAWLPSGTRPLSISGVSVLDGRTILTAAPAPEGIWVGTRRGLYFYDRQGIAASPVPMEGGKTDVAVRALAVRDREVWVGADDGLRVLDSEKMTWTSYRAADFEGFRDATWYERPLLPDSRVTALACDDDEYVWGGTAHGGFVVDGQNRWMTVLPEEQISSIALGSARAYIGTDRGLFALDRLETGVTRRHLHKDQRDSPLRDNDIRRVFVEGPEVWAATERGVRKVLYDHAEPPFMAPWRPSVLGPEGVLVVMNEISEDSQKVASAYMKLREIPAENLCRIVCPEDETISRSVFDRQIRDRIWQYLREKDLYRKISFIVTTKGVPLRIASAVGDSGSRERRAARFRDEASVDSELTLLARQIPVRGALPNPYLHNEGDFDSTRFGMYLVARLDAPSAETAIDMVRRTLAVEEASSYGSRGFARFDLHPDGGDFERDFAKRLNRDIRCNYELLREQGRLHGRVALPEKTNLPLYRENAAFSTFFYVGHGAGPYKPEVFSWVQGAVGVCVDPLTAETLRSAEGSWAAHALEEGLCGTIGSVYHPGRENHISIANLYWYLNEGFTWAEAAYMCIPGLSWQSVVLGDPLYRPMP